MALRIRRGTDAQRTGKTFEMGEIVWTTDSQQMWVGNGITAGGVPVVGSNVAGYGLTYNNVSHKLEVSGLTSDDVAQGNNNKYFSTELAVDAVGAALVAGNATNVGITFTYAQTQDDAGRINATVALDGIGITSVVEDTSPQLGGDLDLNTNDITGTGNINITGLMSVDGLGADLDLNTNDITGTGNINITGYLSDSVISSTSASGPSTQTTLGTASKPVEFNIFGRGNAAVSILGLSTGGNGSLITFKHSNGTYASPTITVNDDIIGGIDFRARNSSAYVPSSLIAVLTTDPSITGSSSIINSTVFIGNSDEILGGSGKYLSVGPTGKVTAASLVTGVYVTTPSDTRPTGVKGMIIYNDTAGKFQGFNGSIWVDLN